jgi:hypothetical protein
MVSVVFFPNKTCSNSTAEVVVAEEFFPLSGGYVHIFVKLFGTISNAVLKLDKVFVRINGLI